MTDIAVFFILFQLETENHQLESELQDNVKATDDANEHVLEILDKLDAVSQHIWMFVCFLLIVAV